MKLTDFALIFVAFFLCILTKNSIKNDLLYDTTMFNIMYNACMDEIVIDSLKTSFYEVDEDGNPVIDKDALLECYKSEISLLRNDTNLLKETEDDNSILILTQKDGFYIYSPFDGWSNRIDYENSELSHLEKVVQIETMLEEKYGIELLMAKNDGESFKNSITDCSLIAIYKSKILNIDNNQYFLYTLSGACVLKN